MIKSDNPSNSTCSEDDIGGGHAVTCTKLIITSVHEMGMGAGQTLFTSTKLIDMGSKHAATYG